MDYRQKEKQDGVNKTLLAHTQMHLNVQKEKAVNAPIGLFGAIGIILYVLLFHGLANVGFGWFLGLMISFGVFAFLGYVLMEYLDERRSAKRAGSEHDPDSGSDR